MKKYYLWTNIYKLWTMKCHINFIKVRKFGVSTSNNLLHNLQQIITDMKVKGEPAY